MGEEILAAHECILESFIAERRGIQNWFYECPILENAKVSIWVVYGSSHFPIDDPRNQRNVIGIDDLLW